MPNEAPSDWIRLDDVECGDAWIEEDDGVRWRTNRLFDPGFPFSTDVESDQVMGVVVEVDPGHACERHTHDDVRPGGATGRRPGDGTRRPETGGRAG